MSTKSLLLLAIMLATSLVAAEKKHILSFGGNGMIGSEVVHRLLNSGQDYEITMVSRQNWHFDSGVRIMPRVNSVYCDRSKEPECLKADNHDANEDCDINTLRYCADLMKVVNATERFDAVLDFSGYEPKWIHDAVDMLVGKDVGVYIYISSDSVYEVCEAKPASRRSLETDAVRPVDLKKRQELNAADRYGDAKLTGEEALEHQRKEGGIPFVSLRFADVIGPRDTTYRWCVYHLWTKFFHDVNIPVHVPENVVDLTTSFTFVEDAAEAVVAAVNTPEAWDQAYNIASEDDFNLKTLVEKIASALGVSSVEFEHSPETERSFALYPTVYSGPVDVSKAKRALGFRPTSLDQAVRTTVDWYERLFVENEAERDEMIKRFATYVLPRKAKNRFYLAVDRELEKAGVVDDRFRKKRKGDLEEFDDDEDVGAGHQEL